MKTFVLIFAVLFSGCGCEDGICNEHLIVDGLTIISIEGADISGFSAENISRLIQDVNDSVNQYYPGLDLQQLIQDKHLEVLVYPFGRMLVGGVYFRGNQTINLSAPDWDNWENSRECLQMYYTLGHELLHFVVYNYLNDEDGTHSTDNIFFFNCGGNIECRMDTAEWDIWEDFGSVCGYSIDF